MLGQIIIIAILALETYALADNSGLLKGKYSYGFLGYYTSLSNILVYGYFILVLFNIGNIRSNSVLCLSITMAITLTFLIYHFLLSPDIGEQFNDGKIDWNPYGITNMSLHYYCPILTIIYFYLCSDLTGIRTIDGIKWVVLPLIYIGYILIRVKLNIPIGEDGHYYPYDFMDIDKLGGRKVLVNCTILFIVFALLGLLVAQIAVWVR